MVLLPVVRLCISHKRRLIDAVSGKCDCRDAEAGEGAFEAVEACEGARVAPGVTTASRLAVRTMKRSNGTDTFAHGSGREGFFSSCCGSNRGSILRELRCSSRSWWGVVEQSWMAGYPAFLTSWPAESFLPFRSSNHRLASTNNVEIETPQGAPWRRRRIRR